MHFGKIVKLDRALEASSFLLVLIRGSTLATAAGQVVRRTLRHDATVGFDGRNVLDPIVRVLATAV